MTCGGLRRLAASRLPAFDYVAATKCRRSIRRTIVRSVKSYPRYLAYVRRELRGDRRLNGWVTYDYDVVMARDPGSRHDLGAGEFPPFRIVDACSSTRGHFAFRSAPDRFAFDER